MTKIQTASVQVKICGITNEEDALWAVNFGSDFIGLNFYPESPRKVGIDKARDIAVKLPSFVKSVGIFVNPTIEEIEKVLKIVPLFAVQLHGEEKREDLEKIKSQFRVQTWKAIRIESEESLKKIEDFLGVADQILLDTLRDGLAGGTGQTFDWNLAVKAKSFGLPIFLAGGLKAENVKEAILAVEPKGVDAAGGVEKEGHPRRKDIDKMKLFISKAKGL